MPSPDEGVAPVSTNFGIDSVEKLARLHEQTPVETVVPIREGMGR